MPLCLSFLICKIPAVMNILISSSYYVQDSVYHSKCFGNALNVLKRKMRMRMIETLGTEASKLPLISCELLAETPLSLPLSQVSVYPSRLYCFCIWLPAERSN